MTNSLQMKRKKESKNNQSFSRPEQITRILFKKKFKILFKLNNIKKIVTLWILRENQMNVIN